MNPVKVLLTGTLVAFVALSLLAAAAFAQKAPVTGTLTGIVISAPNAPSPPAISTTIRVGDTDLTIQTGGMGNFTISSAPADPS